MNAKKDAASALNDDISKGVYSSNFNMYSYRRLLIFLYKIQTSLKLNSSVT